MIYMLLYKSGKVIRMKKKINNLTGILLLIFGAVLIAAGIAEGEYMAVFEKAIRICLECIGIG